MNKLKPIMKKFIELSDDEYILSSEDELILNLIQSNKTRKENGLELILKAQQSSAAGLNVVSSSKVFNPFGDFEEKGYLRNNFSLKDVQSIKKMEQAVFYLNFKKASDYIRRVKNIEQSHIYRIHEILFSDLYPWAGKSRYMLSDGSGKRHMEVRKGSIQFLTPWLIDSRLGFLMSKVQNKVEYKDLSFMRKSPGSFLGDIALIHPFLDGNGRTILVLFNELIRRNGLQINWQGMDRKSYLVALTQDIESSNTGAMNTYISQFLTEIT